VFLPILVSSDNVAKFIYVKCSVIKFGGGTAVLYPLAKYQPKVKPLHGRRVHVVV
jgi:hypothetical protein